jgi:hypothetical protein
MLRSNRCRARFVLRVTIAAYAFLSALPAQADAIVAVPTNWRLENYSANGGVNLWYTGSPCASGGLILPASATEDTKDRLWSLILTAKASSRPVGIIYHSDSGNCVIDSFYMDGPN